MDTVDKQSDAKVLGPVELQKYWVGELTAAIKREKEWRKQGSNLVQIYEADKNTRMKNPYNILYTNTETLSPAIYNNVPRPTVKPRFVQPNNALTQMASLMGQRLLQFTLDDGDSNHTEFDEVMRSCITEGLVPGRGQIRIRYDAVFQEELTEPSQEQQKEADAEGQEAAESVQWEGCFYEHVAWDDFLHGFAKKWEQVPWVAYKHAMTKDDLKKNFGVSGKRLEEVLPASSAASGDEPSMSLNAIFNKVKAEDEDSPKGDMPTIVWEVWDKVNKHVIFLTTTEKTPWKVLEEDPLGLQGFFPSPRPLSLYRKIADLTPQALYEAYEQQAEELNDVTIRITRIIRALRVRGFYNTTVEQMGDLFKEDDNALLPITNAGQIGPQGIKLDDAIWLFPVEKLVSVLQQLYTQRQQIKAVIFELSGIADIMRGSSQASETLGAQQLKNQWGTLRLKRMQKEAARFSRDALRIQLELMVEHLSPETLRAMSGMPLPTDEEQAQAQQEWMAQAQQAQMTGQPVPEKPAELKVPSINTLKKLLSNDTLRNFAIDVETNSTVDAEATEDKQDMAELMNAFAQFLNGVTPLVEAGAMPFDAAKVILLNLLRRFRMGGEVEEAIMAIQPPSQGGAGEKKQLEQMQQALQKAQEQLQKDQQALQVAQQDHELAKRSAEHEITMQRNFAMREIDQQKDFAKKELEQERTFMLNEVEMAKQAAIVQAQPTLPEGV